ncbi:MAG: hypothetical protein GWP03_00810 [Proteobacteria bacterium]|nr:hypothetical protein [Pseudomonadota bacterium]
MIISPPIVSVPPKIDGVIENIWLKGDSAANFTQYSPLENTNASAKTIVYAVMDSSNLYFAFKCFKPYLTKVDVRIVPRDSYTDIGDNVWIMLDANGDKTTAYEFGVNAAGVQNDDELTQDGRVWIPTYDGLWYSATKITNYGYNVEIKIPFRALRFRENNTNWGINFYRYISSKNEFDSWIPLMKYGKERVSNCGLLKITPPPEVRGLHLNIAPVGILKYEDKFIPKIGLDINWSYRPSANVSLAIVPDFAQIEADPYRINLSKYELYFPEKRPFFTQQSEYFKTDLTSFIMPFYSRRIGRRLQNGTTIPIYWGSKYTATVRKWNIGLLNAMTASKKYRDTNGDTIVENINDYYCIRIKKEVFYNSNVGMIYAGKRGNNLTNEVYGFDGSIRNLKSQLSFLMTLSNNKDTIGYGSDIKYEYDGKRFIFIPEIKITSPDFNIDEVGYSPYKGYKEFSFFGGRKIYNKGFLRYATFGIKTNINKAKENNSWGYKFGERINIDFNNKCSLMFSHNIIYDYEANKKYRNNNFSFGLWSDSRKALSFEPFVWFNSYEYNYSQNHFGADGGGNFDIIIKPNSRLNISLSPTFSVEWKANREIENISYIFENSISYFLAKDLSLRLFSEPNTYTHIHYFSGIISWNFMPASWFFLAYNQTIDNTEGNWKFTNRIIEAKVRYLFFW